MCIISYDPISSVTGVTTLNKTKDKLTFEELFKPTFTQVDLTTNQSAQKSSRLADYNCITEDLEKHLSAISADEAYFNIGINHAEQRKLKKGKVSVKMRCDLHGYTREQALAKVRRFLQRVQVENNRYALIIFGKGHLSKNKRPIIKPVVLSYLKDCPQVLAYTMAHPKDGGSGAAYIILRRLK